MKCCEICGQSEFGTFPLVEVIEDGECVGYVCEACEESAIEN